ncbi:MAG: class I SAM-dependent methyltransferase [Planctomycetota bacterium]
MEYPNIRIFESMLKGMAPYMSKAVEKARTFSPTWEREFEETLSKVFAGDEARMRGAIKGYVEFALDALRLHKRFEKELKYIHKTYAEVGEGVYHNLEYMFNLYLPGILISQYLWPHHYEQLQFFTREFGPLVRASADKSFADVGVGTGFYSRQILSMDRESRGTGFDISAHSLNYAAQQIRAFQFQDRWTPRRQNILTDPPGGKFSFVVSVEVLEHLEDPVAFIRGLKAILAPGGYAFITAAITAPNADHIYLYADCESVEREIKQGGFEIVRRHLAIAYPPKANEPVPQSGIFICR